MSNSEDIDRLFKEIAASFKQAEDDVKAIEELCGDVAIPAINELRYAGFHVLKALSDGGQDRLEQLRRAKRHCERASFDAIDAGIIFCLESFQAFQSDFRFLRIEDYLPEYVQIRAKVRAAKDFSQKIRSKGEDRYQQNKEIRPHLNELLRTIEWMNLVAPDLAEIDARRRGEILDKVALVLDEKKRLLDEAGKLLEEAAKDLGR